MKYERIEHGVAKKWEFIYYLDYANDKVKYPLREGKSYSILYGKNKKETYIDNKQNLLIRIKNITMYADYKRIAENFKREGYIKSVIVYPPPSGNFMSRYFVKYLLEKNSSPFETSAGQFQIDSSFYTRASLKWQISGEKEFVLRNNSREIKKKSIIIPELKSMLDPFEFYREEQEELTPQEMTMKRLEKLLHNQHSYTTKQEALNVASALGLSGVHQMSNGNWMPGSSHQAYKNAMQQESVTTPVGTIPTQNITGGSGY